MASNIRPSGVFDTDYTQDIALNRTRTDKVLSFGLFILLLLVPFMTAAGPLGLNIIPSAWIGIINRIAIFTIAVQGLNILVGFTGQVSLGHAAFMAVGAYSAAILARGFELFIPVINVGIPIGPLPFWLVLPIAAIFTGFIGLLFGLPSLRVKGFYLAMATLAAQFIIPWVLRYPLEYLTKGSRPLEVPVPNIGGIRLAADAEIFYLIIPLAVGLMLAARNIIRTRVGRAFISVRDNDLAAELLGINIFNYKLLAFFIAAVYAGIAGALQAYDINRVSLDFYRLDKSIEMLAMLIVGGAGFPLGAVFGAGFFGLLNELVIPPTAQFFQSTLPTLLPFVDRTSILAAINPFLFGLALIAFLILMPRGLAHRWEILKIAWKIRPYSH